MLSSIVIIMKLILAIGLSFVITAVQAEFSRTENQNQPNTSSTSNTTSIANSTSAWDGPVNITEPTPGTKWKSGSLHTINWTDLDSNVTDNSTTGDSSTQDGVPPGHNTTDSDYGNTHGNDTQNDHISVQLAVGGNVQTVDLVFPLAHNVSKSNGTTQIMVPQHITGGKNFTLAVGHPDQGVSFVTGIEIETKNCTHDKNGSVNPDCSSSINGTT